MEVDLERIMSKKELVSMYRQVENKVQELQHRLTEIEGKRAIEFEQLVQRNGELAEALNKLVVAEEKIKKWDEFRDSLRDHKCKYGIICVEKIDAEHCSDLKEWKIKESDRLQTVAEEKKK